jgi:hypothetical protein
MDFTMTISGIKKDREIIPVLMNDYLCLTTARIDIASTEIDITPAGINSIATTRINYIAT